MLAPASSLISLALLLVGIDQPGGNRCKTAVVETLDFHKDHVELSLENGTQPLEHVRIHILSRNRDWKTSVELLRDYLIAMHTLKEMKLDVLISDEVDETRIDVQAIKELERRDTILRELINKSPAHVRERVYLYFAEQDLEFWAQDSSKPLRQGHPLVPASMDKNKFSHTLASTIYSKTDRVMSGFEGGNLVVGQRHIFTLSSLMSINSTKNSEVSRFFGKPVFALDLDSPELPHFHMNFHSDLIVAIVYSPELKQEVVLLNSPQMAMEVFSSTSNPSYESQLIMNDMIKFRTYFDSWNDHNLRLVQALSDEGYQVRLIPGVTFPKIEQSPFSFSKSGPRSPLLYYNYVNAVFSEDYVLMPWLEVPELDDSAAKVYKSLGLHPIPMPSARKLLPYHGAIRCASYTGRRTCDVSVEVK